MICLWKLPSYTLVLESVGGLSLLERAALTAHSAGISTVIFPLPLQGALEKIRQRHPRLASLKWIRDSEASEQDFQDLHLEWSLDWVIWPPALSEFLDSHRGHEAVLASHGGDTGIVLRRAPTRSAPPRHHLSRSDWPLMKVASAKDLGPLAKKFYRALRKPTDGFVSRHFNRPLSIAVSSVLVRFGVSPSFMTTFCILLTVAAALMALSPQPYWLGLAGVLFHLASTLDGCDGEIARLTFSGTTWGAWYDTLGDNARYGFFFACLGLRAYHQTQNSAYVWALTLFIPLMIYFVWLNARYLIASNSGGTFLVMASKVVADGRQSRSWWDRIITPLQPFTKLDVQAFAVMAMCLLGFSNLMFWISLVGLIGMTLSTARTVKREELRLRTKISNHWAFFFLLMGSFVFVYLLREVPFSEIWEALQRIGWGTAVILAIAPFWFFCNSLTLWTLCRRRVPLRVLYYNHLVGEGYNNILPLAGLAGEPFKLRHLTEHTDAPTALRVIVQDKIMNAMAGMLLIALLGGLSLFSLDLDGHWKWIVAAGSGSMALTFSALLYAILAEKPLSLLEKVFARFGFSKASSLEKLSVATFLSAFSWRFLGRIISVFEVAVILYFLGLPSGIPWASFMTFMISASGLIFFMVPQGIGVNEVGLAGAFRILGWSTPLGVALALARRARIVFWSLVGISWHAGSGLLSLGQQKSPAALATKS